MNVKEFVLKLSVGQTLLYTIGLMIAFLTASSLVSISYLYPYIDVDSICGLILIFIIYYIFGGLFQIVSDVPAITTFKRLNVVMFAGMILFLLYLIPYKNNFENNAVDENYHSIIKNFGLNKDQAENEYNNKDIDDLYAAYKARDISKLNYFKSKENDIKKIDKEIFYQLIVNIRVLNKENITKLYNESLIDKFISINEYNKIVNLIIEEELKIER